MGMRRAIKKLASAILIVAFLLSFAGCELIDNGADTEEKGILILLPKELTMELGDERSIDVTLLGGLTGEIEFSYTGTAVKVSDGVISALAVGTSTVTATVGKYSSSVTVEVVPSEGGSDGAGDDSGIDFPKPGEEITSDPYADVDPDEFYASYRPAVSYMDSYYRSLHNLMSGEIGEQDQAPTIDPERPTEDGLLVRNTRYIYSSDGTTYYVVNSRGEIVNEIYRGGAYIMLEEVAAYVFAFGEIPANHVTGKKVSPASSPWGEYLRLNHSSFSGNTSKYPYEPKLPNISGCGGSLSYYEMDIGTTGTDCDSSYSVRPYNNGSSITRGAARIVYARYDLDRDGKIEPNETYLFYTYNHYNDFREYLNYENGWGEMFGNITGGGTLSSKTHYNPTPYVEVALRDFGVDTYAVQITVIVPYIEKRRA